MAKVLYIFKLIDSIIDFSEKYIVGFDVYSMIKKAVQQSFNYLELYFFGVRSYDFVVMQSFTLAKWRRVIGFNFTIKSFVCNLYRHLLYMIVIALKLYRKINKLRFMISLPSPKER